MQRWQDYSLDPNAPDVMVRRREALRQARAAEPVFDRTNYLCQLADGKTVLDIGIVEHTLKACDSPNWLHRQLSRSAAHCVGLDVLPDEIEYLRSKGFNVVCADITIAPLAETFEIIVAGEVLEHIDAPGAFMSNCAKMLAPGGRLVITVPNPWYANVLWKNMWRRHTFVDSADHVAWYDASTLYELGQRHRLMLDRFAPISSAHSKTPRARMFFASRRFLIGLGLRPELFAKSIIFEFIRI